MADKVTVTSELKLIGKFVDNDTRTVVVDDPIDNITAAQINAFGTVLKNTNALIGDKAGANFLSFTNAKVVDKTHTQLDLR